MQPQSFVKEIQEILKQIGRLAPGENAVLATVVDVVGSSYRLPGAKMLIRAGGETFGTVSGGCLEADVLERARKVSENNAAQILVYDTGENDESVFALNMGCRGVVRILLEPARRNDYLEFVERCFENRHSGAAAILINCAGEIDFRIGSRFFLTETGEFGGDFRGEIEELLFAATRTILETELSQTKTFRTKNGTLEFFLEFVKPPLNLIIFGAGADASPLLKAAKNLGWRASIIDHRRAFANTERFPEADEILTTRPENLAGNLEIDENTAAVVMTHNYEHDKNILRFLLASKAFYFGALGPKRRIENILGEWRNAGENISNDNLDKLYSPVGLDIGADTPEAIAASIVAEIQTVSANRRGGFLRERNGSIYNRNAVE